MQQVTSSILTPAARVSITFYNTQTIIRISLYDCVDTP